MSGWGEGAYDLAFSWEVTHVARGQYGTLRAKIFKNHQESPRRVLLRILALADFFGVALKQTKAADLPVDADFVRTDSVGNTTGLIICAAPTSKETKLVLRDPAIERLVWFSEDATIQAKESPALSERVGILSVNTPFLDTLLELPEVPSRASLLITEDAYLLSTETLSLSGERRQVGVVTLDR